MEDILFASLKIKVINKESAVSYIKEIHEDFWFYDEFRNCYMLPLMNYTGKAGRKVSEKQGQNDSDYLWVSYVPDVIRDYFDDVVFPVLGEKTRVIVIRTPPGERTSIHIDCSPDKQETIQHKMRIVLQGESNSLLFMNGKEWLRAPETELPFIMDGSWPHMMINDYHQDKYTICIGAPWEGSSEYPEFECYIDQKSLNHPEIKEEYYNKKYFKKD